MKVKVSKIMAKTLRDNIAGECIDKIYFSECTLDEYGRYIGDIWENESDYNTETGKMKVITVVYRPECYAMNNYLTTRDLLQAFRNSDRTMAGFLQSIVDIIAI